jgi:type I restriction enzyme S subunit
VSEVRPLRHVASVSVSNVDKKTAEGQVAVRLCNYTDVYYGDRISPDLDLMRASATPEQLQAFRLQAGDVIITKDSEDPWDIAVPAFVSESASDLVCGYHLAVLRPKVDQLDGRYLYWAMSSRPVSDFLSLRATGITRFGLRTDSIASTPLPWWPVEQQRAIADFLDAETARIDALIAKKRQLGVVLHQRRRSATLAGVAGSRLFSETRPTTLAWLSEVPSHWGEVMLKLVARIGSGHTPSRDHPEWWVDCVVPWVTTGEVSQMRTDRIEYLHDTREKISHLGIANSSAVVHPAGTVVLCRTAASAGYSAILANDMATSQDIVTWTCGRHLRPRFLLLCLRAMRTDLLDRLAMGSTHKTIYMPDLYQLRIPLPPVDEQNQIVEETWQSLRTIDAAIDRLVSQIELLSEHRQALITAAVTGELDIPGVAA